MRLWLKTTIFLLVTLLPVGAMAQMADQAEVKEITEKYDLGLTNRPSLSILDWSRFDISHVYSIGYFSGGGFSGTQALYQGNVRYRIADPLTLHLNLGVMHDPGAIIGDKKFSENSRFLPSGWLDWRPSDNFRLIVGFETVPAYYYGGNYYYRGGPLLWRDR